MLPLPKWSDWCHWIFHSQWKKSVLRLRPCYRSYRSFSLLGVVLSSVAQIWGPSFLQVKTSACLVDHVQYSLGVYNVQHSFKVKPHIFLSDISSSFGQHYSIQFHLWGWTICSLGQYDTLPEQVDTSSHYCQVAIWCRLQNHSRDHFHC